MNKTQEQELTAAFELLNQASEKLKAGTEEASWVASARALIADVIEGEDF